MIWWPKKPYETNCSKGNSWGTWPNQTRGNDFTISSRFSFKNNLFVVNVNWALNSTDLFYSKLLQRELPFHAL